MVIIALFQRPLDEVFKTDGIPLYVWLIIGGIYALIVGVPRLPMAFLWTWGEDS